MAEKKLTKRELKKIEEEKEKARQAKFQLRRRFISELHSFWADVEATARYCKINNISDKVKYNGSLVDEEKKKLFNRYELLPELINYDGKRDWDAVYTINSTNSIYNHEDDRNNYTYQKPISATTLIISDIIWDQEQFDTTIELARKLGYTEVLYIDSSTACAENVVRFVKIGSQILGTNARMSKWFSDEKYKVDKEGIILSIPEM